MLCLLSITGVRAAFDPDHRVDDDPGLAEQRRVVAASDDAGDVYAVWEDRRDGDWDLRFAKSSDDGATFSPSVEIGGSGAMGTSQTRPAIALGPDREIVVAWEDDRGSYLDFDIYATRSSDSGVTFSAPVRVSDGPPGSLQLAPSVAVSARGDVFVSWQDSRNGNGDIRLSRTSFSGFTFGASVRVDDDPAYATQAAPSVAVSPLGSVYVAYHDNRTGNANVYLAASTDGGGSFGPSVRVDDTGTSSSAQGLPSLGIDSLGNLTVAWQDNRNGNWDVYLATSVDGGRTFSPNVHVDDGSGSSDQTAPRLAVGLGGRVYVAWEDSRNGLDTDLYVAASADRGATFGPSMRADDAPDSSSDPATQYFPFALEIRSGVVFALWQDARRDDGDVYAARAALGWAPALRVDAGVYPRSVAPGVPSNVTVEVTRDGAAEDGASLCLTASAAGVFTAPVSVGGGLYRSAFTPSASLADGVEDVAISVYGAAPGTVGGAGQTVLEVVPQIALSAAVPYDRLAVGQTMEIILTASTAAGPLAGASVLASTSRGGSLVPTTGTTDAHGVWKTMFAPLSFAAGTTVTVILSVSEEGYLPARTSRDIAIVSQILPLSLSLSSEWQEMMSYETAWVVAALRSGNTPVAGAVLTVSSQRGGNLTAVEDRGDGTYRFGFAAPRVAWQTYVLLAASAAKGGYAGAAAKISFLIDPNATNPTNPTPLYLFGTVLDPEVPSGSSVVVSVWVCTMEGYSVSGATVFLGLRDPSLGTLGPVTDRRNGLYTFTYTASVVTSDTVSLIRIEVSKYGYQVTVGKVGLIIAA